MLLVDLGDQSSDYGVFGCGGESGSGRTIPDDATPRSGAVATGDAQRPGAVTVEQMRQTLAPAAENTPEEIRVLEPLQIRRGYGEPAALRKAPQA